MTTGPYADAFEAYRAAGWPGVIPLPARKKANPPRGTTGETGIVPSYADCLAWAEGPEGVGNIALRLPHGVLGVDVDQYDGKTGAQTLAAAEAAWGPLPATWRTTSRDDGVSGIRLYQVPEGLAWPGELGADVELIQHRHRYAVAPPSIHPEGRTYRWITPEGVTSTTPPDADQLPPLPDAWIAGLTGGEEHRDTPRNDWSPQQVQAWLLANPRNGLQACARMNAAAVQTLLQLAAGASAHGTTATGVMRVIRLADEGHAGALAALGQLYNAFIANVTAPGRPGHTRTPGEAAAEWRRAVDSAAAKVSATSTGLDVCDCDGRLTQAIVDAAGPGLPGTSAQHPQPDQPNPNPEQTQPPTSTEPPRPDLTDPAVEDQIRLETLKIHIRDEARRRAKRQHTGVQPPPPLTPLDAFLAVDDEPQQYRVEGLWPVGGRVMLVAQFKSGKTTLVGNLVRSLADGDPFLDRFLVRPADGQIVVIDNELDERMLRRWLRDQHIRNTHAVTVLPLRGQLSTFDLIDPDIRAEWAKRMRDIGAKIIVLDCLAPILDILGLSEDKEAGQFLIALDEFADQAGVEELVLVHHMGHSGERARGASRLRDWPDVEWRLVREKTDEDDPSARRYFSAYGRDVDVQEAALDYLPEVRRLVLAGGSRASAGTDEARAAVLAYLLANKGSSGRQIEIALAPGVAQNKIRAAVKGLVADGKIAAAAGLRGATLYSVRRVPISNPRSEAQRSDLGNELKIAGQGQSSSGISGEGVPISVFDLENSASSSDLVTSVDELKPQVSGTVRQSSSPPRQAGDEELVSGTPLRGEYRTDELRPSVTGDQDQQPQPQPPHRPIHDDIDERINRALGNWGLDP